MSDPPDYHHDAALFRDALRFTAATTGFGERLVEKDYYCSLILADLRTLGRTVPVFKGGTCLSKVHADYSRLSEDLDFTISMVTSSARGERRRRIAPIREHLNRLPSRQRHLRLARELHGFNQSTQYGARITYASEVTGQDESIKIEVSLREPIVEPAVLLGARTVLLDPFSGAPAVPVFSSRVLSLREAYAEKLRAALTRPEPAIRDFFDLDHAITSGRVDVSDTSLVELLRGKLSVPGTEPVDVSPHRFEYLRSQIRPQLEPVLRDVDLARFDLDRAVDHVARAAQLAGAA
ncbi:MAG: nucleotidyl transferase AbiEii/AbiGii toxin family protein [Acidobacteria bacterium]|nr:nucleotidyl transferase AbiEii/AbiGii toxin family protein [Acidobacteriota bacterium]